MQKEYWDMMYRFKYMESCMHRLELRAKRINGFITGVCFAASLSCVSAWGVWSQLPLLWGILIAAVQLAQALNPWYPYSRQITALKYCLPCMGKLNLEIKNFWLGISDCSDKTIKNKIIEFQSKWHEIESLFITDLNMSTQIKYVEKYAKEQCTRYFQLEED